MEVWGMGEMGDGGRSEKEGGEKEGRGRGEGAICD